MTGVAMGLACVLAALVIGIAAIIVIAVYTEPKAW